MWVSEAGLLFIDGVEFMKHKVLFVDDEPAVLSALQRVLRPLRSEWEMEFVDGAAEALRVLQHSAFDAVVTDMKMPGMSGADLLEEVRAHHPECLRFVLSGESDKKLALRAANVAHQYLAKPCDITELKQALMQAFALKELMQSKKVKDVISQVTVLPSIPSFYAELLHTLESPLASNEQIGKIVKRDLAMATKILKIANSALFGLRSQVASASQAVGMLGTETIKTLAVVVGIFSEVHGDSEMKRQMETLWRHSFAIGHLSRELAAAAQVNAHEIENAFTAGMLHDVGKLLMFWKLPEQWKAAVSLAENKQLSASEAELEILGCTHAEVGAYLLGSWGLPMPIVNAAAWHRRLLASPSHRVCPLVFVHLAHAMERAKNTSSADMALDREFLEQCGCWRDCQEWIRSVQQLTAVSAAENCAAELL